MIEHKQGNLFSVTEGYIIHGCNAQGAMGAGVALTVKLVYPDAFNVYKECIDKQRELDISPLGTNTYCPVVDNKLIIINAITQRYFGNDNIQYTDYDAVRACFRDINKEIEQWPTIFKDVPRVLNFPLIGCGLGGAEWEVIASIIDEEIDDSFEKVLWTI
jgi:O-acetyl-ADP-ribose deacetylase (regulator of RNase III)